MPRYSDLTPEQIEDLDPESLKYFKDKEEITDEEYKALQDSSERYDRMMARRYDGVGHTEWLNNIKEDIKNATDEYDTEEYMNKVWDWHYNVNKTCFKWDNKEYLSRPFTAKEATLWKYRTLPKQFRDHGIIWILMEHSFQQNTSKYGPIKQGIKKKKKIDRLENEVEQLKTEVNKLQNEVEELKEQVSLLAGDDFFEKFKEMKKELKELRKLKKEWDEVDNEIYGFK